MSQCAVPTKFSDLNPFVEKWDKPGTNIRYKERFGSTYDEILEFYSAMTPRIDEIKSYLDSIPMEDYTAEDLCLGRLVFAWITIAGAVEVFKQSNIPDAKTFWNVHTERDF